MHDLYLLYAEGEFQYHDPQSVVQCHVVNMQKSLLALQDYAFAMRSCLLWFSLKRHQECISLINVGHGASAADNLAVGYAGQC